MSGFQDLLDNDPDLRQQMMEDFNPGKYRGLISHVGQIKENIERDKKVYEKQIIKQKETIEKQEAVNRVVQRQLSQQIEITNRGYSQLLAEHQNTLEESKQKDIKLDFTIKEWELKVKELEIELKKTGADGKKIIQEKEIEILTIQKEKNIIEKQIFTLQNEIESQKEKYESILEKKENGLSVLIQENTKWRIKLEEEKNRVSGIQINADERVSKFEEVTKIAKYEALEKGKEIDRLEKILKEKDKEIFGLLNRSADYDPEKELKDALKIQQDKFDIEILSKEKGYDKLIVDFSIMEKKKQEEIEKLRENFAQVRSGLEEELHITRLEITKIKDEHKKKEFELKKQSEELEKKYDEMEKREFDRYEKLKSSILELEKERDVALEAMIVLKEYTDEVKKSEEARKLAKNTENTKLIHKIKRLERDIEEVNKTCENLLKKKDKEVAIKMDQLRKLQEQLTYCKKRERDIDFLWEERMREKEIGIDKMLAEVEVLKEELVYKDTLVDAAKLKQIAAQKKLKLIEKELQERILEKQKQISILELEILKLKDIIKIEIQKQSEIEEKWKAIVADLEDEMAEALAEKDEQILELKTIQKKLEKTIQERLFELNELREEVEDLQKEMEQEIQSRDRIIQGLKSEIQYLKETFEETIAAMKEEYRKLKEKYDAEVGPGGVQDAKNRAEKLERDLAALREVVEQLKNKIAELRSIIREKEMEIDECQKETMDLIFIKEAAYKKLASENADLVLKIEEHEYVKKEIETKFQRDLYKMKKYFERLLAAKDVIIKEKEEIIEDQKKWVDEIVYWKKENEKSLEKYRDLEDEMEKKICKKEEGFTVMMSEIEEMKTEIIPLIHENYKEQLKKKDKEQLKLKYESDTKYEEISTLYKEILKDKAELKSALAKAIADGERIDPEKVALEKLTKEQEITINESKKALELNLIEIDQHKKIVEETKEACNLRIIQCEKIEYRETKRREYAELELEKVKQVCTEQIQKAEEICKTVEERYRALPNPFEDEVIEVRERVEQQKAGIENLRVENDQLVRELENLKKEAAQEKKVYEKKLVYATTVLNEISDLKDIHGLAEIPEGVVEDQKKRKNRKTEKKE